jgi:hypothetical protein
MALSRERALLLREQEQVAFRIRSHGEDGPRSTTSVRRATSAMPHGL